MNLGKLSLAFAVYLLCGMSISTVHGKSKVEISKDMIQQLIADINNNKNNFRLSAADLEVLHKNLKYKLYDLNGDEAPEFFLYIDHSDWCGAGGSNCSYWVYQKTRSGYTLLIEGTKLKPAHSFTKGYKDLIGEQKGGWGDYLITTYKFNGKKYKVVKQLNRTRVKG